MQPMEEQNLSQHLRFADMTATSTRSNVPVWAKNSQTTLAYGTGRLPPHARQIGWQPVAGVGAAPVPSHLSSSMQSLRRRIVRGEA
jgi:hypothetical protein